MKAFSSPIAVKSSPKSGRPGQQTASSLYPPGLQALARRGLATLGQANDARVYRQLRRALRPGRAAALLAAERGDR